MRGVDGRVRAARAGLLGVLMAAALAGCAAGRPDPTTVPGFAAAPIASGPAAADPQDGQVPDDCQRILAAKDLNALLGLPLDSVIVDTTIGAPEPSVGRTERVACRYSGTAPPVRGRSLLMLNSASYTDPEAATAQWRRNADAEDGDRRELNIGTASAVLIERPREAVLAVAYATTTVTMVLPAQPLPGNRARGDVLVDLALRVLPVFPVASPAPSPVPLQARPTGDPAQAAATQR